MNEFDDWHEAKSETRDDFDGRPSELQADFAPSIVQLPRPEGSTPCKVLPGGDFSVIQADLSIDGSQIGIIVARDNGPDGYFGLMHIMTAKEARAAAAAMIELADELDPQGRN